MARPLDPLKPAGPVHELHLQMDVNGQQFSLSGVFALEDGMAAFNRWVQTLGGGVLTAAQVTDLLARAEKMAARLESVDTQT